MIATATATATTTTNGKFVASLSDRLFFPLTEEGSDGVAANRIGYAGIHQRKDGLLKDGTCPVPIGSVRSGPVRSVVDSGVLRDSVYWN